MRVLKSIVVGFVAAAVSGCVPAGGQGHSSAYSRYQQGLSDLRLSSLAKVDSYSRSVAEFLETNSEEEAINQAEKSVADSLKDPSSAQFRNVRVARYKEGAVICGEVNGKNSYGGYVGFKRFVASTTESDIVEEDRKHVQISRAANAGLDAACP